MLKQRVNIEISPSIWSTKIRNNVVGGVQEKPNLYCVIYERPLYYQIKLLTNYPSFPPEPSLFIILNFSRLSTVTSALLQL